MKRSFLCPRCGGRHPGTYFSTGAPSMICDKCNPRPDRDVPSTDKPKRNSRKAKTDRKKVSK